MTISVMVIAEVVAVMNRHLIQTIVTMSAVILTIMITTTPTPTMMDIHIMIAMITIMIQKKAMTVSEEEPLPEIAVAAIITRIREDYASITQHTPLLTMYAIILENKT